MPIEPSFAAISCPQCGSAIADLEAHRQWHEHINDSMTRLGTMVVDTSARLVEIVDEITG